MKSAAAALCAALVFAVSTGAFAQHKLEYKPSGATPIHYKAHTVMNTLETVMGQQATVSGVSDQLVSMTSKMSGENIVYDITIDSSYAATVMPNGDTTRLTSSPSVGQTKQTVMRPDGQEISTTWLDTTFAKTQAGQEKQLGSFFFRLPDKEVSVGSTWNEVRVDTVERGAGHGEIFVQTDSKYKLVGEEKIDGVPCVKIVFDGTVSMKGSTAQHGIKFDMNGAGNISGTAFFDYTNGRIFRLKGMSDQKMTLSSSGEQKMDIPVTQKANYELFLVR